MDWSALKQALISSPSKGNADISNADLRKFDLTRKYDELLDDPYETLTWKDHVLLYTVLLFVVLFIIWGNLATVDEMTRGTAKVVPSSKIQIVQNLEGGIIEELLVKEGDSVEKGQIVLRMKNVESSSDYKANLAKHTGISISLVRLKAQLDGSEPIFPDDLGKGSENLIASEMAAYRANTAQYNDQLRILKQQKQQREQEVRELNKRISGVKKVLTLSEEEKSVVEMMISRGAASKYELLQLEGRVAQQSSELGNLRLSLPRARSTVLEAAERILEHKSASQAMTQRELSEKTVELNTIKESLTAFKDRDKRTDVRAPSDGIVKEILLSTIGGVVRPGQELMEIVPLNDLLIIEADIMPSDIGFLYPGQKAIVKITAYDYSIYGSLDAVITAISADSIMNDDGDSFYRVTLERKAPLPKHEGANLKIIPGMVASVDILTGKKTIMGYLLKPFIKTLDNAFHER